MIEGSKGLGSKDINLMSAILLAVNQDQGKGTKVSKGRETCIVFKCNFRFPNDIAS